MRTGLDRDPSEDRQPVPLPELLLAPKPRIERLSSESGANPEHQPTDQARGDAQPGPRRRWAARSVGFGLDAHAGARHGPERLKRCDGGADRGLVRGATPGEAL